MKRKERAERWNGERGRTDREAMGELMAWSDGHGDGAQGTCRCMAHVYPQDGYVARLDEELAVQDPLF